jgi:hypothetical protein
VIVEAIPVPKTSGAGNSLEHDSRDEPIVRLWNCMNLLSTAASALLNRQHG